jgi:hypothetical protein
MEHISYGASTFKSGRIFRLLRVCEAGLLFAVVLLWVRIAGLSCGAGTASFFLFFPATFAFLFPFFSFAGLEVGSAAAFSCVDVIGYSMESGSSWFEPVPDLQN